MDEYESPRAAAVQRLLRRPDPADLPQIRALTRAEIAANRADGRIGCGDTLYALCFLLYLVGDAEDVALVHEAKRLNMDTGTAIESDMLAMRRDREAMLRTAAALEGAAPRLAQDIASAFDHPAYPSPVEFIAALRRYFGLDG